MSSTLHGLVAAAAERHADRDAVVLPEGRLSYAELEAASNRLAHSLIERGVRRGDRVGLWLPKSLEAVVALYAAMKAGAAYVPIDPAAPPQRMGFIARDAKLAALVTRADRAAGLEEAFAGGAPMKALWTADPAERATIAGVPVVPWDALAAASDRAPAVPVVDGDLAYVLYTSGSTGEPKGVMLTHRNGLAFVRWAATTFALRPDDRLSNHAPFHFDLSTFDLFGAAHAGAAVYPVPPRLAAFPAAIAKFLAAERLSVWYATPSTLGLLLSRGGLADLDVSTLRVLLFAGEVMPPALLRRLMALAPRARCANLYGPTETNVCTWHEVTAPPVDDAPLPIGVACCDDEAFVLDETMRPVADGATGELWIRGATVMSGYWGAPERTALALQPIEVGPGLTDLAYRTGDLVRRRADGALEFLGRRDHQIKTRGYRVELGEIESVLHRHPAVSEAVAYAVPDDEIGNRLRAAVVLAPGATATAAELQAHCATALPRYMVPETIDFHPKLPRTSSGKIDRRALAQS